MFKSKKRKSERINEQSVATRVRCIQYMAGSYGVWYIDAL